MAHRGIGTRGNNPIKALALVVRSKPSNSAVSCYSPHSLSSSSMGLFWAHLHGRSCSSEQPARSVPHANGSRKLLVFIPHLPFWGRGGFL